MKDTAHMEGSANTENFERLLHLESLLGIEGTMFLPFYQHIASDSSELAFFAKRAADGDYISALLLSYVYLYMNDIENALKMADFAASGMRPLHIHHALCLHLAVSHISSIQISHGISP